MTSGTWTLHTGIFMSRDLHHAPAPEPRRSVAQLTLPHPPGSHKNCPCNLLSLQGLQIRVIDAYLFSQCGLITGFGNHRQLRIVRRLRPCCNARIKTRAQAECHELCDVRTYNHKHKTSTMDTIQHYWHDIITVLKSDKHQSIAAYWKVKAYSIIFARLSQSYDLSQHRCWLRSCYLLIRIWGKMNHNFHSTCLVWTYNFECRNLMFPCVQGVLLCHNLAWLAC